MRNSKLSNNNVSMEESIVLKKIRSNKDVMIMKVDKGNIIIIMETDEYHKKMMEHLTTSGSLKKVEKGPNNRIMREITKEIQSSSL